MKRSEVVDALSEFRDACDTVVEFGRMFGSFDPELLGAVVALLDPEPVAQARDALTLIAEAVKPRQPTTPINRSRRWRARARSSRRAAAERWGKLACTFRLAIAGAGRSGMTDTPTLGAGAGVRTRSDSGRSPDRLWLSLMGGLQTFTWTRSGDKVAR
jgi:hypothetical protein